MLMNSPGAADASAHDAAMAPLNDFFPPFTRGEMLDRRHRAIAMMEEKGYDALVIWGGFGVYAGSGNNQTNMMWLANYAACVEGYLVVARDGTLTLILCVARHVDNAKHLTGIEDVRGAYDILGLLAARLKELRVERGRIGIVGPHNGRPEINITIPFEHHQKIVAAFPNATLADATRDYEALRLVRSREELDVLRRAGSLGDEVFREIVQLTKPGASCRDLRRHAAMRCAETGGTLLFCHVGSFPMGNPADSYPDYYPSDRRINDGDVLYTELCLGYGNYWNKIWGTWFCGRPADEYLTMFSDAAKAHGKVLASLKPGMRASEFDRFALELRDAGYDVQYPLISGWSAINHDPQAGGVPGERSGNLVKPYSDWIFRPGETYTICAWITQRNSKKGVWVGTSGTVSDAGFERFNDDYHPFALKQASG